MAQSIEPGTELHKYLQQGFLFLQGKLMRSAAGEFEQALALDSKLSHAAFNQHFGQLLQRGAFEEALGLGKLIVKYTSNNYVIFNHMGNCARHLKLRDVAEQYYQKALELKPSYQKPYLNIGANRAKLELYDLKIESFLNHWVPHRELMLPAYFGNRNLLITLREQIEEEGESADPNALKAALAKRLKTRWKTATPNLAQQVIGQDKFNIALYALQSEEFEQACEVFGRLRTQAAPLPRVEQLWRIAQYLQDNSEDNHSALFELANSSPYDRWLNFNTGVCCLKTGQFNDGYHFLCKAALLLSRSQGLINFREILNEARNVAKQGDVESAIGLYQEALLIEEQPEILAEVAKLYQSMGHHEQALETFLRLKERAPEREITQKTLQEVHDAYLAQAEQQLEEQQFTVALKTNDRAESLLRQTSTLTQKARIFRVLNRSEEGVSLDLEVAQMKVAQAKLKEEAFRQSLILAGKKLFRAKDYLKATKVLEQALAMKKDHDLFLLIAGIYKNLKHSRALNDLLFRYNEMPPPPLEEPEPDEEPPNEELTEGAPPNAEDLEYTERASRPQFDLDF